MFSHLKYLCNKIDLKKKERKKKQKQVTYLDNNSPSLKKFTLYYTDKILDSYFCKEMSTTLTTVSHQNFTFQS